MKTPRHWQKMNLTAALLFLPSCLYALATWVRIKLHKPQKVNVPVICIGNLTAGGSGKTPTATSIAQILKQNGKNPFFVSRGYGGTLKNVLVDVNLYSPQEVGDEPLLLAHRAPVVINSNRFEAAKLACENGADIIIMDDGFQNPTLFKDKSFLVIDGGVGLGNMLPIPAGPMREFFNQGIKRADAVIILGEDKHNIKEKFANLPIFYGEVVPIKPETTKSQAIAFAGIGRPEKFYQSLKDCGINLINTFDFPDHHFYTRNELNELVQKAQTLDADLFTTAKDMVKIPADLKSKFKVLDIEVKWQDEAALKQFLLK